MEQIVDIATDGRRLSALRGFMLVADAEGEVGRVPLDDVAAVVIHAHGVTWSTNLACALAERGAPIVFLRRQSCAGGRVPAALREGHHAQNAKLRAQWAAPRPLSKQLWRTLVVAKIRWQAAVLEAQGHGANAFDLLARRVRSGDPDNIEAQAARRYWPMLMGPDFRRDRDAGGANGLLNYGYTVMRALCARSVVASGLHPSIGVHLTPTAATPSRWPTTLIEPFRTLVDALTVRLLANGVAEVTPLAKRAYARLSAFDLPGPTGATPVSVMVTRTAQGLARAFEAGAAKGFAAPEPPLAPGDRSAGRLGARAPGRRRAGPGRRLAE